MVRTGNRLYKSNHPHNTCIHFAPSPSANHLSSHIYIYYYVQLLRNRVYVISHRHKYAHTFIQCIHRQTHSILCTLTGPLTTCKKCPHVLTFTSFSFMPSSLQERRSSETFQLNSVLCRASYLWTISVTQKPVVVKCFPFTLVSFSISAHISTWFVDLLCAHCSLY